jgi:V/A-type H+/Na+-transporting ATPase subunit K
MRKLPLLLSVLAFAPVTALAQTAGSDTAVAADLASHWPLALAFLGAAIATALPCWGSAMGVSMVGQAGSGLLTEKPELAGKVITLSVLPGSQGLYGMVISLLFLFSFGLNLISGEATVSGIQAIAIFAAFIPVAVTCITSAPYQAKVCAAGMHMLARDGRLAGRVITLAALVETYALLGFLISFFMLNALAGSILKAAA